MKEDQNNWETSFDKELTYGVLYSASSDLSSGEGREMRYTSPEPVKKWIKSNMVSKAEMREIVRDVRPAFPDKAIEFVDDYEDYCTGVMDAKVMLLNKLNEN